MKLTIQDAGDVIKENAEGPVVIVQDESLPPSTHIEVKVTEEGVITEIWDDNKREYTSSVLVLFSDLFEYYD